MLVTSRGANSVFQGKKHGFNVASTAESSVLDSEKVNTVVIATQHDLHARQVIEALKRKKHIFVEKPLAINLQELEEIKECYDSIEGTQPNIMIGFIRRFSPHVIKMKTLLRAQSGPKVFVMTVNAGEIADDHWTQDPLVGGGRIIGEGCHFIDLLRYLAGAKISEYSAEKIGDFPGLRTRIDKATITLSFEDGSFGTIHYLANGSKTFPKERLEVFCNGGILQLDNFKRMEGYGWKGFKKMNLLIQDKGQYMCVKTFVDAIENGKEAPISFDEIYEVSKYSVEILIIWLQIELSFERYILIVYMADG